MRTFYLLTKLTVCALIATCSQAQAQSQYVLRHYGASWCPPCRQLGKDLVRRNGVLYKWVHQSFVKEVSVDYSKAIKTPEGRAELDLYGVTTLPTFVVTDMQGGMVSKVVGYFGEQDLINRLMAAPRLTPRSIPQGIRPREPPEVQPKGLMDGADDLIRKLQDELRELRSDQDDIVSSSSERIRELEDAIDVYRESTGAANKRIEDLKATIQSHKTSEAVTEAPVQPETAARPPPEPPGKLLPWLIGLAGSVPWLDIAVALGLGGTGLGGGVLAWKAGLALARSLSGSRGAPQSTFRQQSQIGRDTTELEQVLSLRQQEQRQPLHDAFFGVALEDELRKDPEQSITEAFNAARHRFDTVAPLSLQGTSAEYRESG